MWIFALLMSVQSTHKHERKKLKRKYGRGRFRLFRFSAVVERTCQWMRCAVLLAACKIVNGVPSCLIFFSFFLCLHKFIESAFGTYDFYKTDCMHCWFFAIWHEVHVCVCWRKSNVYAEIDLKIIVDFVCFFLFWQNTYAIYRDIPLCAPNQYQYTGICDSFRLSLAMPSIYFVPRSIFSHCISDSLSQQLISWLMLILFRFD